MCLLITTQVPEYLFQPSPRPTTGLPGFLVDESKLESMLVGGASSGNDGTIDVAATLQVMPASSHPAGCGHSGALRRSASRCEERWSRSPDGTSPLHSGPHPLITDGRRCAVSARSVRWPKLDVQISVHVRIPLIGGKLEKLIGGALGHCLARTTLPTTRGSHSRAPGPPFRHALSGRICVGAHSLRRAADFAANLELVRDYSGGRAADAERSWWLPGGHHVPVRRPAGSASPSP